MPDPASPDAAATPLWDLRMLMRRVPYRALDLRPLRPHATVRTFDAGVRKVAYSSECEPGTAWWTDRIRRTRLYLRRVETGRVPASEYESSALKLDERAALLRAALVLAADVLGEAGAAPLATKLRVRLRRLGRAAPGPNQMTILRHIGADLGSGKLWRRTGVSGPLELRIFADAEVEWLPETLQAAKLEPRGPDVVPSAMEMAVAGLLRDGLAGVDGDRRTSFAILRHVASDGSAGAAMSFLRRHAMEVQSRRSVDDGQRQRLLAAVVALHHVSRRRHEDAPLGALDPQLVAQVATVAGASEEVRRVATQFTRHPDSAGTDATEDAVWAAIDAAASSPASSHPRTPGAPSKELVERDASVTTLDLDSQGKVTINGSCATYLRGGRVQTLSRRHRGVAAVVQRWEGRRPTVTSRAVRDLNDALHRAGAPGSVQVRRGTIDLIGVFSPTKRLLEAIRARRK